MPHFFPMHLRVLLLVLAALFGTLVNQAHATEYVTPVVQFNGEDNLADGAASWVRYLCSTNPSRSNCQLDSTPVLNPFNPVNYQWSWRATYSYTDAYGTHPGTDASSSAISYTCPSSYGLVNPANPVCKMPNGDPPKPTCNKCEAKAGNPIILSTRIKQQIEVDYRNATGTLEFVRTYRSDLGKWANNYQINALNFAHPHPDQPRTFCVMDQHPKGYPYCYPYAGRLLANDLAVQRGNGRTLYFGSATDVLPGVDINDRLTVQTDDGGAISGYLVSNAESGATETFDEVGRLKLVTQRNGQTLTFSYSDASTPLPVAPRPGLLMSVMDSFGNSLGFNYNATAQIVKLLLPDGQSIVYQYDTAGNVTNVIFPDGKQKTYIYNELANTSNVNTPWFLTGISDENGGRYATFKYDGNGKAMSTEHAGGQEKYQISNPDGTRVVDPLGTARTYYFDNILGAMREYSRKQPLASGASSVYFTTSYDANANISATTDYNGVQTAYYYDLTRNLETKRVEANGTSLARTTSTEWHSTFRLPLRIAEPKRITTYTYDANGNALLRSVQATADANGANGFNAAPVGSPRSWSYTYSSLGQMLTSTGPSNDVTTYAYDSAGNLSSITNPAGHVTSMANYDANGNVGRITDPNGLVTDLTYTPRGWLASKSVGSQVWHYEYDGVGQLILLTAPDNSTATYTYDGAHRLTAIADSAGNTITYTLDGMGNRISEVVKDPGGNLARQTTRAYDSMNRLKQLIGGAQ